MGRRDVYSRCFWAAVATTVLFLAEHAHGDSTDIRPTVRIRAAVTVRTDEITLGDIAQIRASDPGFKKLVDDLRSISLGVAPPPKTRTTYTGARILELIRAANIPLDAIGYSIPQTIEVEREGRTLTTGEVLTAVREQIARDTAFDLQVRDVQWEHAQIVPGGALRLTAERLGEPSGGKLPLRIIGFIDDRPVARFVATALVDDWREVPVLKRELERGMLIAPDDIELVRLNLFKQPNDIASSATDVIGRRALTRLGAGETIRRALVDLPPTIPQGKQVTIVFRSGALTASATGVAIDAGHEGSVIRVRNTSSKKLLNARVLSPDQVEVSAK